jgi:ectoine hydroxylase-related dioxygenase (phytanoyl-CoA dioxygenase family)
MRSDLGGHVPQKKKGTENVTQIMWPSDFVPGLVEQALHQRALAVARQLLGNDMAFDFDMLIDKAPLTDTPTPWHQDAAYWIDMPDRRAVSGWIALDEATVDNGCMWFVPGSHRKDLRTHQPAGKGGGALQCQATEIEGVPIPLKPGSATFHHGATLHYSRGNTTTTHRRAYIVNFRPEAMVQYERQQGFDHGRSGNVTDRSVRNEGFQGKSERQ